MSNSTDHLPESWVEAKLNELVQPDRPKHTPKDFPKLPFIGMENIEPHSMKLLGTVPASSMRSNAVHFYSNDVLYGRLRPYLNKVYCPDFEGLCSAEFIVFPPTGALHPRYLQYFLNCSAFVSFASHLNAGDRPRVDFDQLGPYPIPVPPIKEQERITAEIEKQFTRLDAAVAALKRVQANLKRYRAAVLKAACEGRLVPTEAELARRESRSYEPASVLLHRTLAGRRSGWEAIRLHKDGPEKTYKEAQAVRHTDPPALPEGWTWATWEQLSTRVTVGHVGPMKDEYVPEGIPFLRSQNVRENRFDSEGLLHISTKFHAKLAKSELTSGDLVVVRSGSVGTTCVIPDHLREANCADLVIIKNPLGISPFYGSYYMNSLAKRYVQAGKVGVALTHFNTKSVAQLPIALPPEKEQARIVEETQRRLSIIDESEQQVEAEIARSSRLRQSILKSAFEGKLVPQDPNDEPASTLLDRIRGTANPGCVPMRARGYKPGRRVNAPKETVHA